MKRSVRRTQWEIGMEGAGEQVTETVEKKQNTRIMESLDPRIKRLGLGPVESPVETNSHLVTWEVFHQEKRGKQPVHVGPVHAANPEMALVMAKEAFGRRGKTTNLWVVKTSDIFTFSSEDEDIFETAPEKLFREPATYKVRDRIEAYRAKNSV